MHWDDVQLQEIDMLPYDIDGHCKYLLHCEPSKLMSSSKDGRPWKSYISSSRKGFSGIRRIADCKGSSICNNLQCPYIQEFNKFNTVQFESSGLEQVCSCCGELADHSPCEARKIWEFEGGHDATSVIVYHEGKHSCTAVRPKPSNKEYLEAVLKENKQLKPVQIPNQTITRMIDEDNDWDEITNRARELNDLRKVSHLKHALKRKVNSHGHSFDAVAKLREKAQKKDPFFIHSYNSRDMNPSKPTYVFKSSTTSLHIVLKMDQSKDHFMREEYCFFNGTHSRCHGLKTLTLWTYQPLLRKVVKLATMDCDSENKECISLFWTLWNNALAELSGIPNYHFNPKG